ncbi:hypothetical protein [Novosphingobium sp. FKTRR1]|uniref:hypothetical protein n=1 Tax=unclassified Novosphingobium TaxID=2644732 RepID=UPI001CEFEF5E|nr:hypothetical protein [Novosphingobium sp. FKTRR1]
MTSTTLSDSAVALARRSHVESLLGAYPDVTPDELALLQRWFRSQASALDVAMVACNEQISAGYRQFRRDHIDRFTWSDVAKGFAGAAVLVLCVVLILLRAW